MFTMKCMECKKPLTFFNREVCEFEVHTSMMDEAGFIELNFSDSYNKQHP
jgi:hypothetical protein